MTDKPNLSLVPTMTVGERIKRAQAEAQGLARAHLGTLATQLEALRDTSAEIESEAPAYPPGAVALARRLKAEMNSYLLGLQGIIERG